MSPALTGRFFTTESPGKSPLSLKLLFLLRNLAKRVWSNCLSFWSSWRRSFPLLGGVGGSFGPKVGTVSFWKVVQSPGRAVRFPEYSPAGNETKTGAE